MHPVFLLSENGSSLVFVSGHFSPIAEYASVSFFMYNIILYIRATICSFWIFSQLNFCRTSVSKLAFQRAISSAIPLHWHESMENTMPSVSPPLGLQTDFSALASCLLRLACAHVHCWHGASGWEWQHHSLTRWGPAPLPCVWSQQISLHQTQLKHEKPELQKAMAVALVATSRLWGAWILGGKEREGRLRLSVLGDGNFGFKIINLSPWQSKLAEPLQLQYSWWFFGLCDDSDLSKISAMVYFCKYFSLWWHLS